MPGLWKNRGWSLRNLVNRGNVLKNQSMFSWVSQMDGVTCYKMILNFFPSRKRRGVKSWIIFRCKRIILTIAIGSCEELITAVTWKLIHLVFSWRINIGKESLVRLVGWPFVRYLWQGPHRLWQHQHQCWSRCQQLNAPAQSYLWLWWTLSKRIQD